MNCLTLIITESVPFWYMTPFVPWKEEGMEDDPTFLIADSSSSCSFLLLGRLLSNLQCWDQFLFSTCKWSWRLIKLVSDELLLSCFLSLDNSISVLWYNWFPSNRNVEEEDGKLLLLLLSRVWWWESTTSLLSEI